MSILSKYGNAPLTECSGDSPELQAFNALPTVDEKFIEDYLINNCDESVTSLSQFPDPFLFKGMKEAVELFIYCIRNHKRILCISDSDCDGVGSRKGVLRNIYGIYGVLQSYWLPKR